MATLKENVHIIRTAIYGKEMRPAIAEALTQSWASMESMMADVDKLAERVNNLIGGGSGGDNSGGVIIDDALIPPTLVVYGAITAVKLVANTSLAEA